MADRKRVELDVFLEVELLVMRIDAAVVGGVSGLAGGILGEQGRRLAADELVCSRR
jgi:hypothetical protein